jgi:uncharacterized cupredoxin-like copper-binding protein
MYMSRDTYTFSFDALLNRRVMPQGAGALGIAAVVATPKEVFALSQGATPADLDYPEVVITATEYAFDMPATFESGLTKLVFNNDGMMDHHAIFLKVNEGATIDAVHEALALPEFGPVFSVSTAVGGPNVGPGESTTVVVDFEAGQYVVICAIPDEAGVPHYALGMISEVEVTEGTSTAEPPVADGTVHLVDFGFHDLPADVKAGPAVWEVINDGPQLHEIVLCQLAEGVSFDQVLEMMTAEPPASPAGGEATAAMEMEMAPPFTTVAGVAPMNASTTNWLMLDLAPGEHFAICFVPDIETGAPHFALGMIMPFTVS